ncbi:MAG: hypothetical protein Alpg2KO_22310 [Alphaproteobacteria bacterium]
MSRKSRIPSALRKASPTLKKWAPYWRQITNGKSQVVYEGFAMLEVDLVKRAIAKGVSLRGADLSGIEFTGTDLRNVNFSATQLESSRFGVIGQLKPRGRIRKLLNKAPIVGEHVDSAILDGARFRGSVMHRAQLRGVSAVGADFGDADMTGADLAGADLTRSIFDGANMAGVMVDTNTKFSKNSLKHAVNVDRMLVVDRNGEVLPAARVGKDGKVSAPGGILLHRRRAKTDAPRP